MPRLSTLLAISCLGTGAALLGGRALLEQLPPVSPASNTTELQRIRRWSVDPWRRREASLLLAARLGEGDPTGRRQLLAGQGWGSDPLAAVVLKQDALAAAALGQPGQATALWRQLLQRFPQAPASADALYALGRRRPALRQELLQRFPAHPAALAAALEAGPGPAEQRAGVLHLARWGPRWPGAGDRLIDLCRSGGQALAPQQRAQLAVGLAELGNPDAALACLGQGQALSQGLAALPTGGQLALARTLLRGSEPQQRQGEVLLLELVQRHPTAADAEEAVRLLSQQPGQAATALLTRLPQRWRNSAAVASRALQPDAAAAGDDGSPGAAAQPISASTISRALALLKRWPDDPASWDLQWELARRELLAGDWRQAAELLEAIDPKRLAPPLAARQRFWLGYTQRELGQEEAATATWRQLRLHHPGGYYGWRAAVQLGEGDLQLATAAAGAAAGEGPSRWEPLASGDAELDRLWRLDQHTEAWETWRHRRGSGQPRAATELLVEGRLRQGVGDDWTGLGQLELASLRLPPAQCGLYPSLDHALHPQRFVEAFTAASRQQQLPLALLLGLTKQESRFTPAVRSVVGAVGLMQLMPATAEEVAKDVAGKGGGSGATGNLEQPSRNIQLGSHYLAGLLRQWQGDPLLAVASYNAGPGAVQVWLNPRLKREPELWVEAIPYPETRLYVKKVLGNAWSYQERRPPRC